MKFYLTLSLIFLLNIPFTGFAQMDTLFLYNKKIPCSVKEITSDAVKFIYPQEDIIHTIYKNNIRQLYLKSGRVILFQETAALKNILDVEDNDKISISVVDAEVKGLFKLGEVSSKAKGTTLFANQDRVNERAYRKLKIEAAMMGASTIFINHQKSEGYRPGIIFLTGSSAETSLTGIAYSHELPDPAAFTRKVNNKTAFNTTAAYKIWSGGSDAKKRSVSRGFSLSKIITEQGITTLEGTLTGVPDYKRFRLVNFDETSFTIFYKDKNTAYQYRINF